MAFFPGSAVECSLGHACPETNPPLAPVPDPAGAMQCQTAASSAAYATEEGHIAHTCRHGRWDSPPYPLHACPRDQAVLSAGVLGPPDQPLPLLWGGEETVSAQTLTGARWPEV